MNYNSRYLTVRFGFFILMLFYHICSDCNATDHCHSILPTSSVITPKEERDLELGPCNSHEGMLSVFDKTYTASGKKRLMHNLKNPTADVSVIHSQQKKLKLFLENPALLEETKRLLARVKGAEPDFDYFINNQEDRIASTIIDTFYFKNDYLKKFNKSSTALDARRYGKLFGFVMPLGHHALGAFLSHLVRQSSGDDGMPSLVDAAPHHSHHAHHGHHGHIDTCCSPVPKVPDVLPYAGVLNALITLYQVGTAVHVAMELVNLKEVLQQMGSETAVLNQLYKRVCAVKGGLRAIAELNNCVQKNDDASELFAASDASNIQSKVNTFAPIIDDTYFNSKQSLRRRSPIGKTLYNYQLLKEQSASLKECMASVAEVDALVSVAQWYKEQEMQGAPVCFADFIPSSDTPIIKFKDAWHVGLNPATAVASDIELNADKGANKLIITGAHKGGKSNKLRETGLNLVFIHTYGFAAARQAELTPFHKLISYIVVSDDTKKDASSLSAEWVRAEECIHMLQSLPKNQFACLLVDDSLLTHTDAKTSLDESRKFLTKVGTFANSCALIVVQQRELTKLGEQEGAAFKNCRIKMGVDEQGRPKSLFTLEDGVVEEGTLLDIIKRDHSNSVLDE